MQSKAKVKKKYLYFTFLILYLLDSNTIHNSLSSNQSNQHIQTNVFTNSIVDSVAFWRNFEGCII